MLEDIRIAIVDDHPLVRDGLVYAIGGASGFEVVATGETAEEAVEIVSTFEPDVLVLDLDILGSGHQALQEIAESGSRTRVLVLTVSEDEADVMKAFREGASGYALKGISGNDLRTVLRTLHMGGSYLAPALGARIVGTISHGKDCAPGLASPHLSKREADIYTLIRQGYCNKDIGRSLNLSEKTVKHYLTNMFRKMQVRNRMELALLS